MSQYIVYSSRQGSGGGGGSVNSVTASSPLASTGGTNPNITIQLATGAQNGYLSSTDWNTFNNKLTPTLAQNNILVGNASNVATAVTMSGDATIVASGALTIANSAVTNAKMANMVNNTVKGNKSGISAAPSDLVLSDVAETGSAILTITNGSKAVVAAGNLTIQVAQASGSTSGYLSSTDFNTFNNKLSTSLTSAHLFVGNGSNVATDVAASGDLTLANTGAFAIANSAVTNAKMANMAAHTYKGNNTGAPSAPLDVTSTQLTADLNLFSSSLQGLVPGSGGGTTNFLRADGSWAAPVGTVSSVALADGSGTPIYSISGSPVTSTGTLTFTLINQSANTVMAGPTSGGAAQPAFRALVANDIPSLSAIYLPLAGGTMSGSINGGAFEALNFADPVSGQSLTTKNYVDSLVNGLTWKNAAAYATAAALAANTYNNGASGVGATLTGNVNGAVSVDGSTPTAAQRILVKNEGTPANNGIYVVTTVGNGSTPYVLTRSTDFDQSAEIVQGAAIFVVSGTVNAGTAWTLGAVGVVTVGTTALSFTQASGPGSIVAGNGIQISGNTVSLVTPVVIANGGTNSIAALNNNRVMQSSGGAIVEAAAITAARALISDSNGIPTHSAVTATELGYVSGVTSSIQTQLNGKQSSSLTDSHILVGNGSNVATDVAVSGDIAIDNTGATTIQNNVVSNAKLAQMANNTVKGNKSGITANASDLALSDVAETGSAVLTITNGSKAIVGNANLTIQVAQASTSVSGYLSSTDFTTFNNKQPAGNYITALTGDATASGPGSAALTLATVNSNVGSFGSATAIGSFTVNAKGLVTAASNVSIQIAESQVTNLVSDLAGKQPTGNYITALTGDVTATGPGSVAATIAANAVTNAKLAQMPAHTFKGNNTGSTANAVDLTATQLTAELNQFTTSLQGVVPGSGGGTANFLRADGTWAAPAGSSPLTTKGDIFTYSTVNARLPVGTDGQILSSDSTQTTGLKWVNSTVSPPRSYVRLNAGNGHGSTNTVIRRFTNNPQNVGTAITYADSSTNGASFTINEDGVYAISYLDFNTGGQTVLGASVNSNQLTTNIASITNANILNWNTHPSGFQTSVSWSGFLSSGDVVRPHDNGNCDTTNANNSIFTIVQVSK